MKRTLVSMSRALCLCALATALPAPAHAGPLVWSRRAPMPERQLDFAIVAVPPRVYLIGSSTGAPERVQSFDTESGRWSSGPSLLAGRARYGSTAGVLGRRVHLLGGGGNGVFAPTIAAYKDVLDLDAEPPAWVDNGTWSGRKSAASAVLGARLYSLGGRTGAGPTADADWLDDTGAGEFLSPMSVARTLAAAGALDGDIYVAGGFLAEAGTPYGNPTGLTERLDLGRGVWETRASMPTPRGYAGSAVLDGRLFVVGGTERATAGFAGEESRAVEAYDAAADDWVEETALPEPETFVGAASVGGYLWIFSGSSGRVWRGRPRADGEPDGGPEEPGDIGAMDGGVPDAGAGTSDAGGGADDAGAPGLDAGSEADAGRDAGRDAGPRSDGGTPAADAGRDAGGGSARDAGRDAGGAGDASDGADASTADDAGETTGGDAGRADASADAGPSRRDSGTPGRPGDTDDGGGGCAGCSSGRAPRALDGAFAALAGLGALTRTRRRRRARARV